MVRTTQARLVDPTGEGSRLPRGQIMSIATLPAGDPHWYNPSNREERRC